MDSYEVEVIVPNRLLSEEEFKEYNIRSNANTGEWDTDVLLNNFEILDLKEWGFNEFLLDKWAGDEFSDKNKEIDTNEFSDKMELKLLYTSDEYQFIQNELSKQDANKEIALLKILKYETQISL